MNVWLTHAQALMRLNDWIAADADVEVGVEMGAEYDSELEAPASVCLVLASGKLRHSSGERPRPGVIAHVVRQRLAALYTVGDNADVSIPDGEEPESFLLLNDGGPEEALRVVYGDVVALHIERLSGTTEG